jgi:hypothetical protein
MLGCCSTLRSTAKARPTTLTEWPLPAISGLRSLSADRPMQDCRADVLTAECRN